MNRVYFRFYAELNDFLAPHRQQREFVHQFLGSASVKDMIESLGVPHTEVDLILANSESVDFSYLVRPEDRISVYPVFESIDISSVVRVRPEPLREPRFVLDIHLGRLATYLRMLGFDTLYRNDYEDEELARISSSQRRILLTRDRGLLKRSIVTHGYCIRKTDPLLQVHEVLYRFDLFGLVDPFRRCLHCNGLLEPVDKAAIEYRLLPGTRQDYNEFSHCPQCDRIYWPGSHYDRMRKFVENILNHRPADGAVRGS